MPASNSIQRYLRHGTLPQLRLFEASARLGSFTRAAQELHLSQPAASVQIKKLSETLGVPLFEQVGKRIFLTEAGQRVQESCQEIFRVLAELDERLVGLRTLDAGRLRLAVSTTGMCFAPRLLGAFVEQHPQVEASVQGHNRSTLVERLVRNDDDLYLFADRPDLDDVIVQELLPNPLVVLARDDHPLVHASNIPFARLAEEPFLVREEGSGTRRIMMRLFREHGLTPKLRMELGTNEAIKEAILAGLGIALMSRHTFGLDPESSRYRCLDVQGFPIDNHWYFAWPSGKQLSPTARVFLDMARSRAKGLVLESLVRPEPGS
jgi:DNA-binding transcriptional LysR family regulator